MACRASEEVEQNRCGGRSPYGIHRSAGFKKEKARLEASRKLISECVHFQIFRSLAAPKWVEYVIRHCGQKGTAGLVEETAGLGEYFMRNYRGIAHFHQGIFVVIIDHMCESLLWRFSLYPIGGRCKLEKCLEVED